MLLLICLLLFVTMAGATNQVATEQAASASSNGILATSLNETEALVVTIAIGSMAAISAIAFISYMYKILLRADDEPSSKLYGPVSLALANFGLTVFLFTYVREHSAVMTWANVLYGCIFIIALNSLFAGSRVRRSFWYSWT